MSSTLVCLAAMPHVCTFFLHPATGITNIHISGRFGVVQDGGGIGEGKEEDARQ